MANYNIDDLGAIGSLSDSDLIEVLSGGVNYKGTVSQLKVALAVGLITSWNKATNFFPSGSRQWQMYYGTGATTRVDRSGNTLTSDPIVAIALVENASTTDPTQWALLYTIN
jgi:hypothetical protein